MERLTNEQRLTPAEIEAIRKRAEAATEGPWNIEESRYEGQYNVTSVNEMHDLSACLCRPNDAEFIAHARTDIPKLLAEIERLRATIEEIELQRRADGAFEGYIGGDDE